MSKSGRRRLLKEGHLRARSRGRVAQFRADVERQLTFHQGSWGAHFGRFFAEIGDSEWAVGRRKLGLWHMSCIASLVVWNDRPLVQWAAPFFGNYFPLCPAEQGLKGARGRKMVEKGKFPSMQREFLSYA